MNGGDLKKAKEKMKAYRDLFGGGLRADLIDCAKSIIDLENVINIHYDFIEDMAKDAQSSLLKFKIDIGIFNRPRR